MKRWWWLCLIWLVLVGCDPLAPYNPTPIPIVITNTPTSTPRPTATPTQTPTVTPSPTPTLVASITPTAFPCEAEKGEVINIKDNLSAIANENLRYLVYIPPCYFEVQKRFPLVILIHGLSYREQQWEEIGMIQALDDGILAGRLPPMILVMPYMGSIGQFNQFPPDPSYERVILEELLPTVERNFCIWQNRQHRALAGISRGGFWAFSIGMRHPEVFGILAAHSGFYPNNTNEIPPPFNPLELALSSSTLQEANLRIYMDNGAEDSAGPSNQLLSSRLTQRSIQHTYIVNSTGAHDNEYWGQHVTEYLDFYGKQWERDYNALPSCTEPSP